MKKTIWGNTLIKNEDRYLWYSVKSVIDYLEKILIWDTGSTDNTLKIIESLKVEYPDKVIFKQVGNVDEDEFTKVRQEMLNQTKGDWILILDGDEVWWEESIKKIVALIQKKEDALDAVVVPVYNLVGDIYHYQEKEAGEYQVLGQKGHFNLRLINRQIPGLHVDRPYGHEGYFDEDNTSIQKRGQNRVILIDAPLMHFTHLKRSSKKGADEDVMQRRKKYKYELGIPFAGNFKFPEALYSDKPEFVESVWQKMTEQEKIISLIQTPLRKLKRRLKK